MGRIRDETDGTQLVPGTGSEPVEPMPTLGSIHYPLTCGARSAGEPAGTREARRSPEPRNAPP